MSGSFTRDRSGLFGLPDLATFGFCHLLRSICRSGPLLRDRRQDWVAAQFFTYSLIWYALATLIMGFQVDAPSILPVAVHRRDRRWSGDYRGSTRTSQR